MTGQASLVLSRARFHGHLPCPASGRRAVLVALDYIQQRAVDFQRVFVVVADLAVIDDRNGHAVGVGLRHDLAHFGVNGGPLDIACATAATERQNVVKGKQLVLTSRLRKRGRAFSLVLW